MTLLRLGTFLALASAWSMMGCKERNIYIAPSSPKVTVVTPARENVTRYLEVTGNISPYNSVELVARVEGFLQDILYIDGKAVRKGDQLFVIEPLPYLTKLQQAEATQSGAQALLDNKLAELNRQQTLVLQSVASVRAFDDAKQASAAAKAALDGDTAAVQTAAINYSYTHVTAPFDGVVSAHRQSVGQMVGTTPTTLATIVQESPIYVVFTVSESDVLRIQKQLRVADSAPVDMSRVPVEVGLQDEEGYPHVGKLDYIAPTVDQNTGTLLARGILSNEGKPRLYPGFFARVRVPIERDVPTLVVPTTAIGADQAGRFVLIVDQGGTVQQRKIEEGDVYGDMRAVLSGLKPDDRVIVAGLQRAVPGSKVDAQTQTASQ